jgi:hypothetical protein
VLTQDMSGLKHPYNRTRTTLERLIFANDNPGDRIYVVVIVIYQLGCSGVDRLELTFQRQ